MDFRSIVDSIPAYGPLIFWKTGLTVGYNATGPADQRTASGKITLNPGDVVVKAADYTAQGVSENVAEAASNAADWIGEQVSGFTSAAGRTADGFVTAAAWLGATAAVLYFLHRRGSL